MQDRGLDFIGLGSRNDSQPSCVYQGKKLWRMLGCVCCINIIISTRYVRGKICRWQLDSSLYPKASEGPLGIYGPPWNVGLKVSCGTECGAFPDGAGSVRAC